MTRTMHTAARRLPGGPLGVRRRRALAAIEAVVALNAFGGMVYALGGASQVPTEWLQGTPFESYLIPGLYLGVAVGGTCLGAAWITLRRPDRARAAAFGASAVTVSWILAQVAMIGYRSPLQPLVAVTGLALAYLAARPQPTRP